MTNFVYTKDNGDKSYREVIPIGFTFGDRNKILCIDLSKDEDVEGALKELDEIRHEYIDALKAAGFGTQFRHFFIDRIEEVSE